MSYTKRCRVSWISAISFVALLAPEMCSLRAAGASNAPAEAVDYHPAVTAFFESKDPFVQQVVLPNIEANRKSDAVLQIVTADGQPMAGAKVSVSLRRHEFLFGHCDLATERDPAQRQLLADLFNYTCPANLTKWRSFAKTPAENDFSKVDAMLAFLPGTGDRPRMAFSQRLSSRLAGRRHSGK